MAKKDIEKSDMTQKAIEPLSEQETESVSGGIKGDALTSQGISATCPSCGRRAKALKGGSYRCTKCDKTFRVSLLIK